jgi:hypothetical protein
MHLRHFYLTREAKLGEIGGQIDVVYIPQRVLLRSGKGTTLQLCKWGGLDLARCSTNTYEASLFSRRSTLKNTV